MLTRTINIWKPAIDLEETETELILRVEVPGVRVQELKVHLDLDSVVIQGEHLEQQHQQADGYLCHELHRGRFERIIPLPISVNTDQTRAELIDGVLTLFMPKIG